MGRVTVTINDRAYRLDCGDGEEARIRALGAYVAAKVEELSAQTGGVGDERLIVMAALTIADELWEATGGLFSTPDATGTQPAADPEPVRKLKALANEIGAAASGSSSGPASGTGDAHNMFKRHAGR